MTTSTTYIKVYSLTLRKHAYSNILKILPPKNEQFQIKNSYISHTSAQNIDCGYSLEPPLRGGFNEYPQSMLFSRNQKANVYSYKPQFYYIKVGFKGSKLYRYVFVMTWWIFLHFRKDRLPVWFTARRAPFEKMRLLHTENICSPFRKQTYSNILKILPPIK